MNEWKVFLGIVILIATFWFIRVNAEVVVEPYQPFKLQPLQTVVDKFEDANNICYVVNTIVFNASSFQTSISCVAKKETKIVVDK